MTEERVDPEVQEKPAVDVEGAVEDAINNDGEPLTLEALKANMDDVYVRLDQALENLPAESRRLLEQWREDCQGDMERTLNNFEATGRSVSAEFLATKLDEQLVMLREELSDSDTKLQAEIDKVLPQAKTYISGQIIELEVKLVKEARTTRTLAIVGVVLSGVALLVIAVVSWFSSSQLGDTEASLRQALLEDRQHAASQVGMAREDARTQLEEARTALLEQVSKARIENRDFMIQQINATFASLQATAASQDKTLEDIQLVLKEQAERLDALDAAVAERARKSRYERDTMEAVVLNLKAISDSKACWESRMVEPATAEKPAKYRRIYICGSWNNIPKF